MGVEDVSIGVTDPWELRELLFGSKSLSPS
jgi:hypothetical protein